MPELKKTLTLFEASVYGIGLILGAGIYVLIGEAAAISGNSLWLSFLFTSIIASFTGLSYAELSSVFPKAAAEYVYVKNTFSNKYIPLVIGVLTIFVALFSAATVALGFAGYLYNFIFGIINIPVILLAIMLIIGLSVLNFYGVKESARLNVIFTAIEAFGLILIIVLGFRFIGSVNYFEMPNGFSGIFTGAAIIFFSYLGFQEMANMAEETKNARRNIPMAIIISMVVTTILYVLVAVVTVSVVPWNSFAQTEIANAPLAHVAEIAMPGSSSLLSFIALFATLNTVLIMLVVVSRMFYGMSKNSDLFGIFSRVHKKRRTPWVAVFITMVIVSFLTMIGNVKMVALITDMGAFVIFIVVNVSLIVLRYRKPNIKRKFKVPINIGKMPVLPLLGILTSLFMIFQFELELIFVTFTVIMVAFVTFFTFDKVRNRVSRDSR